MALFVISSEVEKSGRKAYPDFSATVEMTKKEHCGKIKKIGF